MPDSTDPNASGSAIIISDSALAEGDSAKPKRKSTLEYEVNYQSADSMRIDLAEQKVYLFGDAVAEYGDIKLEADYIEIALGANELHATGLPDSTGEIKGTPVFTQGEQSFESHEMRYNFKTKRGLSKEVRTQEGEGYLHGETVKKDSGDVIYIRDGKYTTCEYDNPHYHIHAGKLKVITKDKIITGPAYLSIADVPTPLGVPFGYFPNSEERSNGLIIPTWGESAGQGFYLSRGGYYFGLGDVMDFALMGDAYTRGSWATYLASRYAKRYRFNGNFGIDYVKSTFSEPEYPDYYEAPPRFNVTWLHRQDPKARPGSNFSADVTAGSSRIYRNNLQSSAGNYLKSNLTSSVRYSKSFANSPFSFSMAAAGSQNTQTQLVSAKLPDASLNMARIYPLKRKNAVGRERWYEKTGLNASLNAANKIDAHEDTVFTENTLRNMKNGAQLQSQASTGIKLFKYLTLTPTVSNRLVGYRSTIRKYYDSDSARAEDIRVDQVDGFWEGSGSLALTTVIYGTYNYRSEIIKAMRHQMTPSVSLSYKPDYSDPKWGYYTTVQRDSLGNESPYSFFEGGIYGAPGAQENGVVNFSLNNTLEMKVRQRTDSTEADKKLRLLDAFNLGTSYNISKDSLNWSPVQISVRTQVVKGLTMNGAATLNPYAENPLTGTTVNQWQYDINGKIGRWTAANAALTWNITPKKEETVKKTDAKKDKLTEENLYYDDFIDFDMPWRLGLTYNIRYVRSNLEDVVTQNLDINGEVNVTQNWRVGYRTSYDITNEEFGYTSLNIYRNLHCWEFTINVIPFGRRQSYNFQINVKSSVLQDLKLNRRRSFNVPER